MRLTVSIALLALPVVVSAATITLFTVQTTLGFPVPSETHRIEGVGADGATTYANEVVFTQSNGIVTYTSGGKTITGAPPSLTITDKPKTIHATLVADASGYVWSASEDKDIPYPNVIVSCNLDGKGGGACVDKIWVGTEPTFIMTYTGSAVPAHTLVTEDGTNNNSSMKSRIHVFVAGGVVVLGAVLGFFLGI